MQKGSSVKLLQLFSSSIQWRSQLKRKISFIDSQTFTLDNIVEAEGEILAR
ncbi:hypothetical protein [Calothrix sp. CCY 0018]|uniref:hypothetical protein n=1 Tax=Calothrix sp. CCY 0018 TaxID=3103864 RepID=UPI0039C6FE8E